MGDFDYLKPGEVYLDAACQSLRPRPVIEALEKYYTEHNSCGERVKYPWGEVTDRLVEDTRKKVLKLLKLSTKEYFVSFTLNTTYGVNLLLQSIRAEEIEKIYTSEIEHNSIFLSTMSAAKRAGAERVVLKREESGEIDMKQVPAGGFQKSVVVVNVAANFDGRKLLNVKELVKRVHKEGGIVILDAAQAMAHSREMVEKTEADAVCFSAHKMYGASLGVMVVRRELLKKIEPVMIGGGMVDDVFEDKYLLSSEKKEMAYTIFEPGLQAWGEIVALGAAIDWLEKRTKGDKARLMACTHELYEFLRENPKVKLVGEENPTMSFCVEGIDSHLLGSALGKEGVMARTGYFCVHYYLDKVCKYPPLVRFSLSYATREEDVEKVKKVLKNL